MGRGLFRMWPFPVSFEFFFFFLLFIRHLHHHPIHPSIASVCVWGGAGNKLHMRTCGWDEEEELIHLPIFQWPLEGAISRGSFRVAFKKKGRTTLIRSIFDEKLSDYY